MSAILCEDRFDSPQIVRPLLPGERLPFYSTAELLLGVCHLVRMVKPAERNKAPRYVTPRVIGPSTRLAKHLPALKELLGQGKMTRDIAAELKVPKDTVKHWIAQNAELKVLAGRRRNRGDGQKARENFEAHENEIREDRKTMSWYALAKKYKFHQYTLQRLLAEAKSC